MPDRKSIYFASDLHLGMHPGEESRLRERQAVAWLESIRNDARELWLLGDVFDYWFEYRKVVPRGFTRFLGKLAELSDDGIPIHIFTGNHDVWMFSYLPKEIGATIHRDPLLRTWDGQLFFLGHGDGLLKSERAYRLLRSVFKSRLLQWCYARIHPNGSTAFAQWWSKKSRSTTGAYVPFLGKEKEHQVRFAEEELRRNPDIRYFLFGHRHVPYDIRIAPGTRVICLGDWIANFTYGVFDGTEFRLKTFVPDRGTIVTVD